MKEKIITEINNQIKEELYSAYLYLAMAADAESKGLKGFANWFTVQFKEETDHAMGFYNFMNERNAKVELQQIDKPPVDLGSPLAMFEATLEHEKHITGRINFLYDLALEEKDHAFSSFLKWYIDEQVEEEANAQEMIDKLKMLGDKGHVLYMLDKELSVRTYVPASILASVK